jgi:ABC-2 type transport system ATP-binding protein
MVAVEMALIEVQGLSKFYGSHAAVRDVSFKINEGEIVGLLGLNGAGKSTILKILGSFLLPSAGSASMAGFAVEQDADRVRELIGYLPDRPPLYDEMKVIPYLRFVARLKNIPQDKIEERIADVLRKTNLEDVAWQHLGELSHGFRQRAGIAQALIHDPRIIILDEPINGLDPVQIVEMRDLILSLRGQHTVILSSHILSEITRTCDRILIIDQGRLIAEGKESELESEFIRSMRIVVEIRGEAPSAAIKAIAGVRQVVVGQEAGSQIKAPGTKVVTIECDGDVRAQIAKCIVSSGAELLAMGREGNGLEAVFMNLVQTSKKSGAQSEVHHA